MIYWRKKTGEIEYFNTQTTHSPENSWTWYTLNFKIKGDTTLYAQQWIVLDYLPIRYFILGKTDFSELNLITKDKQIAFYKDIDTQYSPSDYYVIKEEEKKSPREDRLFLENNDIKMINTYGLVVEGKTILDYTKRGFGTQLLQTLLIPMWLLLIPIFLIALAYVNGLIQYFIDRIPNKKKKKR